MRPTYAGYAFYLRCGEDARPRLAPSKLSHIRKVTLALRVAVNLGLPVRRCQSALSPGLGFGDTLP